MGSEWMLQQEKCTNEREQQYSWMQSASLKNLDFVHYWALSVYFCYKMAQQMWGIQCVVISTTYLQVNSAFQIDNYYYKYTQNMQWKSTQLW